MKRSLVVDRLLKITKNPRTFYEQMEMANKIIIVKVKVPVVPYKFTNEVKICMESRNTKGFGAMLKNQW